MNERPTERLVGDDLPLDSREEVHPVDAPHALRNVADPVDTLAPRPRTDEGEWFVFAVPPREDELARRRRIKRAAAVSGAVVASVVGLVLLWRGATLLFAARADWTWPAAARAAVQAAAQTIVQTATRTASRVVARTESRWPPSAADEGTPPGALAADVPKEPGASRAGSRPQVFGSSDVRLVQQRTDAYTDSLVAAVDGFDAVAVDAVDTPGREVSCGLMASLNQSAQRFARTLDAARRAYGSALGDERLQLMTTPLARARDTDQRLRGLCGR